MTTYDVAYDNTVFENVSRVSDDIMQNATALRDNMFENEIQEADTESGLFLGGYKTLVRVWTFFTGAGVLFNALSQAIGIPPIFISASLSILSVIALFALLYLIFRAWPR